MVFLGVVTHESTSDGTWLLGVILSAIPFWIIFTILMPPWLKPGHNQPRMSMGRSWIGAAITLFLFEFLGVGAAYVLLGASQRELREFLEMLSVPLAWLSPNFWITPDKSVFDVCGVILGNSFFFGLVLFVCYQLVRGGFLRARPTRLSISDDGDSSADDE